jgi:hypothetical protein
MGFNFAFKGFTTILIGFMTGIYVILSNMLVNLFFYLSYASIDLSKLYT